MMLPGLALALRAMLLLSLAPTLLASVVHVRHDAPPGGDGASWATAYASLSDALSAAQPGDQVWIAAGTYRPGAPGSPRTVTFEVGVGVEVYGGFDGSETSLDQRDPIANPTVLSGDLLGDDGPGFANASENAYHVVTASDPAASGRLDGLVITGGNANGAGLGEGGGGGIVGGGCELFDLVVEGNQGYGGAGWSIGLSGAASATGCTFRNNVAVGNGGAIFSAVAVQLERCTIAGNEGAWGGGVALEVPIEDSLFVDCLVVGNRATEVGGGVSCFYATTSFRGCTFAFNEAGSVGGVGAFAEPVFFGNSILWGNRDQTGQPLAQQQTNINLFLAPYTAVEGSTAPWDQDPRWVDPLGPDGVAGTVDDDLRLSCLSPYIDAGRNDLVTSSTDLAGNPRLADDPATPDTGLGTAPIVDLGPYEFVCGCAAVTTYCAATPTTSGLPASIGWSGSTSVFANTFTLHVTDGPALQNGRFYYGPNAISLPFGDGLRCVGGGTYRLAPLTLDANGAASQAVAFNAPPAGSGAGHVLPGSTWRFQFWFRDPSGGPAGFNFSTALTASFCP